MSPAAALPHPLRTTEQDSASDERRRYDAACARAMEFAGRYLPRDQAIEIAHDVASEMLGLPAERVTGTLIYVAVTTRLRMHWRSTERRAAREGVFHDTWSRTIREWSDPGAAMELRELQDRVAAAVAEMPTRMREVFLLIRGDELSYKEAAARLGINVATVHTHFSRATALLRERIAEYHADAPRNRSRKERKP
jgi:RNA polymerase sigma factor (sigma-70 family)